MKNLKSTLKGILVLALVTFFSLQANSGFSAPKSVKDMKETVWRTQSCAPQGLYPCQGLLRFGKEIKERTNGKLRIEVQPSGGLGLPIPKTVSAVRDGLMNMGELLGAFVHGEFSLSDIMELPGLVPYNKELRQRIYKELTPLYEKVLLEKYNQVYLGGFQADSRVIGLHKKRVDSIEGLKGLKLRASGPNEVSLSKALGAGSVSIATPEVYSAMASGTVDASFGTDAWFASGKFWEVTKYVYAMNFDGHQFQWTVNRQDFEALPPDVQRIVREAAANAIEWVWPAVYSMQQSGREKMIKHGVKYIDITTKDWEKVKEMGTPIVEKWVKEGGPVAQKLLKRTREIVDEWKKSQK